MVAKATPIIIPANIPEDRRVVIELPPDTPTGEVTLQVVVLTEEAAPIVENPERERLRQKLLAAGMLTEYPLPEGFVAPSPEAVRQAGRHRPGATPTDQIIREMRDED